MKKNLMPFTYEEDNEKLSENFFLSRNVIKLFGVVNEEMANYAISSLLYLDRMFKSNGVPRADRVIEIWINSPGGSVSDGLGIYDCLNYVDADIRTVCIGEAASMGAFLLSAGTRGMREALPNSKILIHQVLGGCQGQASDILLYAEQMRSTKEKLNQLLALHSGKSIDQIRLDTDRDNAMTAQAACEYGLIDRVIQTHIKAAGDSVKERV